MELTPQVDPDGKIIEFEMKEKTTQVTNWQINKMPKIKAGSLDSRAKIENGKMMLMGNSLKKNSFDNPKENRVILSLIFFEQLYPENNLN